MAKVKNFVSKFKKFDLLKLMEERAKESNLIFEGGIFAFKLPDGTTGTWTMCEDIGIKLRLIQEGQIQERILNLVSEDMAKQSFMSSAQLQKRGKKNKTSYFG